MFIVTLYKERHGGAVYTGCPKKMGIQWRIDIVFVTLLVYLNFLVLLSTTVCSQNIYKQNVNIADETLTDYNFLSRYHYTKQRRI